VISRALLLMQAFKLHNDVLRYGDGHFDVKS